MNRHTTQAGPGSEFFTRTEFIQPPVATESLIAWYPFRSGTGEDVTAGDSNFGDTTDYSAVMNGPTFKPNGGVTDIQTGANSGAFDYDGTDDTSELGTVADSDKSLTLMSWSKFDTVSKSQRIVTKQDGAKFPSGGFATFLSSGKPNAFITNEADGGALDLAAQSATTTNQFVHITLRYDFSSGQATLFMDGQPVDTGSAGQLPPLSGQPWRIGEDNPVGSTATFLDGTVDGVRIYQAALSDSQINQIYLNTKP